jgi:hypothetical protein
MEYAYAYDKGNKLHTLVGARGWPSAILLDASGTLLWKGHPGELEESLLQTAIQGALPKPLWEWAGAAKGVKSAVQKRAYKSALDQAAKLGDGDGGPEILAAIQGLVKSRVDAMKAAQTKGDFLGAQSAAQALQKELAGLPEAADSAKVAADIAADKEALKIIKGQQKVAKIRATEMTKKKDVVEAIDALRKIIADYPKSYVETEGNALIKQLNGMADGLR